ncbi:MAG: hypothetical protein IIC61_14075 [Proteobacteria bacterium]|nr:hypothetical protein [Pseudomonadota bacterium]
MTAAKIGLIIVASIVKNAKTGAAIVLNALIVPTAPIVLNALIVPTAPIVLIAPIVPVGNLTARLIVSAGARTGAAIAATSHFKYSNKAETAGSA